MRNKKGGFTLIELVVVMAIIAILAVLIIGAIIVARRVSTETTNRSNAKTVQTGLEAFYSRYKNYCGSFGGVTVNCAAQNGTTIKVPLDITLSASNTPGDGVYVNSLSATAYSIQILRYNATNPPGGAAEVIETISGP